MSTTPPGPRTMIMIMSLSAAMRRIAPSTPDPLALPALVTRRGQNVPLGPTATVHARASQGIMVRPAILVHILSFIKDFRHRK